MRDEREALDETLDGLTAASWLSHGCPLQVSVPINHESVFGINFLIRFRLTLLTRLPIPPLYGSRINPMSRTHQWCPSVGRNHSNGICSALIMSNLVCDSDVLRQTLLCVSASVGGNRL